MNKRKPVGNKVRFEVFKRDKFQCQYCGRKAPDVVLQCDHIHPVSKGGENDIMNLITSCFECNSGKSNRTIDDSSAIERQREQLAELEERRQQLDAMLQWREGLEELEEEISAKLTGYWNKKMSPHVLNERGYRVLRDWLKKFEYQEIIEAIDISASQYIQYEDNEMTSESVEHCFSMVPRIAAAKRRGEDSKEFQDLYYARGILRNRLNYLNERLALRLLKEAHGLGADTEYLKELAKDATSWSLWRSWMEDYIAELEDDEEGDDE